MTHIAATSPIERIARVLVAHALSPNGRGDAEPDEVVSAEVKERLPDELPRAAAILRALREPSREMVEAGNAMTGADAAEIWDAMVRAALGETPRGPAAAPQPIA
ncbi:hypothetical protein ACBY01_11040 [Sphingomonas sp. ac-8]|uniref:hypothetical protein n=1 Tax=Sphingomonas sp. ac-8 TaxID=3242977 RepID=UPI003A7F9CD8